MSLKHFSLFTGIGGFDLGFTMAGIETIGQCEIDPYARKVLKHHWPEVPCHDDVTTLDGSKLRGQVDIITGGFPCQDVSVAGRREGLSGDRSSLFFQMCRMVAEVRPALLVWENVPGLLSADGRRAIAEVEGTLSDLGYHGVWRVLDSQHFGLAQGRKRVFGVYAQQRVGGWACGAAVLLEPESSRGDLAEDGGEQGATSTGPAADGHLRPAVPHGTVATPCMYDGSTISPTLDLSMLSKGQMLPEKRRCPVIVEADDGYAPRLKYADECAPCPDCGEPWCEDCDAHYADCHCVGPHSVEDVGSAVRARRLTPIEVERLFGFPDGWTDVPGNSDTQRYRQLGNAVTVAVAYWIGLRVRMALDDWGDAA